MSQIFKPLTSGGPIPPNIPTSFVTDSGTAIPALNVLNVLGGSTFSNNVNGIQTFGSGNTVSAQLTNRAQANSVITSDGGSQTQTLMTFTFAAPSNAYNFQVNVVGVRTDVAGQGVGFQLFGTIYSNGVTTTIIAIPDKIRNKSVALDLADVNFVVSGANIIVQLTGVAGTTIRWSGVATYVEAI